MPTQPMRWSVKVNAQAYFGDRSPFHIAIDGLANPIAVAHQNVDRVLDDSSSIGRPVWLSWPDSAGVLLNE